MTPPPPFKFDEIGLWSEIKLEIIERYGSAYTKTFAQKGKDLKKYYIDAFSGPGIHVSKRTKAPVEGSPARALKVTPPFDGFYFIDIDNNKTAYLEVLCQGRNDVHIHTGDANSYLIDELLPTIQWQKYNRALCLLDPYGLHLDWQVMQLAGQSKAIDLFLNFPVMDMNRNAIWRASDQAPPDGVQRMTRFWGDESWKTIAYAESAQQNLFSTPDLEKQDNEVIAAAFQKRLREKAGFDFVPAPLAMKNKNNAIVYYLFFASAKPVAERIIQDIFKKYRQT